MITFSLILHTLILTLFVVRVLLRRNRQPASRIAWILVIIAFPIIGVLAYILFGEVNLGRRRAERMRRIVAQIPELAYDSDRLLIPPEIPEIHRHLFRIGKSINGFDPVAGNRATLMADSNAAIDAMVADIDAARHSVHLVFYIWLPDNNGLQMAAALERAAARGVICRAMADDLGSRRMIHSSHWRRMQAAGVRLVRALPIGNPLLRPLRGRIDLRNHRKILVIDDRITYSGSQNCADPEFRIKAKYAPWVDIMMRFEGPIVRQNQLLFASDWLAHVDDGLDAELRRPVLATESADGFPAQVIGTGPMVRASAMPEVFESLIHSARDELTITTPYYVPDEAMQSALCAAGYRGVRTTIVFPARNDSFVVGAASRSYYADLIAAGVRIFEFEGGLLHAKSLTLDGAITLIGSANMDRRSFEINFENNILLYDPELTKTMRQRQEHYIAHSRPVTADMVDAWGPGRRLLNNSIAMIGPIL
ncbi:cardiolipin synthase [Thiocapsa imhoffii]|uniref:cardiolipin synthase n=1 Tax=Thiocapsa imhoffii TaxID=382777 RepID=UPI001903841B